jgi:predicted N-acetyltransferase YhbS
VPGGIRWRLARASPSDAGALSELEARVWGIAHSKYCFWTWVVAIRNQIVLKAEDRGRIVGGVMMSRRANHEGYYLDLIIVDSNHRNRGIGDALMKAVLAAAGENEVHVLSLSPTNPP